MGNSRNNWKNFWTWPEDHIETSGRPFNDGQLPLTRNPLSDRELISAYAEHCSEMGCEMDPERIRAIFR